MKRFLVFLLLSAGCQTAKVQPELGMPSKPHRHVPDPSKAPPKETEFKLRRDSLNFEKSFLNADCADAGKIAKVGCIFPERPVPFPYCETDDSYAILGVIPYALCTNDKDLLLAHMSYALVHYAPSTIAMMKKALIKLGSDQNYIRPLILTTGYSEKDAEINMVTIWNEWKTTGRFTEAMKIIIEEQTKKEPDCLFYQYMHDAAQNQFDYSLELSVSDRSNCSYYKTYTQDDKAIDVIFVQDQIIRSRN